MQKNESIRIIFIPWKVPLDQKRCWNCKNWMYPNNECINCGMYN